MTLLRRLAAVLLCAITFFPAQASAMVAGDGILIYGESATSTPRYREYVGATSTFHGELSAQATANSARHLHLRAAPTRDEMIMATQSTSNDRMYVQRWNGSSWSSEWDVGITNRNVPGFDVAYEQSSGDAIVVYSSNGASPNELRYRTWNGSSWSSEQNYDPTKTSGVVQYVKLEPRAGTDEVALAWVDANRDLSADYWDGSSWKGEPSAALETTISTNSASTNINNSSFDLAFESSSGDLMVAWGSNNTAVGPSWVIRTAGAAGTWGSVNTNTGFFEQSDDMALAADPDSDYIAYVNNSGDSGNDADAGIWDGSAWGNKDNFDLTVEGTAIGQTSNAITWVNSGSEARAVLTYDDLNTVGVEWKVYDKNDNAWSANQTTTTAPAPAGGDDVMHRLRRNPHNKAEAISIITDSADDLFTKKFVNDGGDGSGTNKIDGVTYSDISGGTVLENTLFGSAGMLAGFAYNAYIPSGGNTLTIDIVNSSGVPVTSPSVAMGGAVVQIDCQTSTGTFGTSSEKMRTHNDTATAAWTVTVAATSGATANWDGTTAFYDFNDPSGSPAGCGDGGDADSYAGQLTLDPSAGTVTAEAGCTTTGVTKGSSAGFNQGTTDAITLLSASGSANTSCYWDFTGVGVSQKIPAAQGPASYTINLTLTAAAA